MKNKKKIVFSVISILILIIIYNGSTDYFGWFHVTDKNTGMDAYYISGYQGNFKLMDEKLIETIKKEEQEVEIEVNDEYTFKLFVDEKEESKETTISEVWDYIQSGDSYFIRLRENCFPKNLFRTYTIEELYLY
jgi:hypothetical protein